MNIGEMAGNKRITLNLGYIGEEPQLMLRTFGQYSVSRPILATAMRHLWLLALLLAPFPGLAQTHSVIVQGPDLESVKAAVLGVGGEISHELGIINAVGAQLSDEQLAVIRANKELRVRSDGKVQTGPQE